MKNNKHYLWTFTVILVFLIMAIASTSSRKNAYRPPPPAPCVTHAAITFSPILVKINFDASYTMKDLNTAKEEFPGLFMQSLKNVNYSYQLADGVTPNLIFYITITNDGNNHYGASVTVNGLGEGYLFRFSLPNDYVTAARLINDMAERANEFVTRGWHSGNCPTN